MIDSTLSLIVIDGVSLMTQPEAFLNHGFGLILLAVSGGWIVAVIIYLVVIVVKRP
ncbi:MAG: hypothetical protein LBP24_00165 [Coriobacteriales bacterium]|nr:hypothetical protein [Coriobacteriales bacterium]